MFIVPILKPIALQRSAMCCAWSPYMPLLRSGVDQGRGAINMLLLRSKNVDRVNADFRQSRSNGQTRVEYAPSTYSR